MDKQGQLMGAKVVVAIDGSENSLRALKWACLNFPAQAQIIVVHAYTKPQVRNLLTTLSDEDKRLNVELDEAAKCEAQDKVQIAGELAKEAGFKAETMVLESNHIREQLVNFCEQVSADNLVLASRGMGTMGRLLLGSVSDYCAHHCGCPVTVVAPAMQVEEDKPNKANDAVDAIYKAWYSKCAIKDETVVLKQQEEARGKQHNRNIIVAIDGSAESEKAFMWAAQKLSRAGDTLTLATCFTPIERTLRMRYFVAIGAYALTDEDAAEYNEDICFAAESYCNALLRHVPSKLVKTRVVVEEADPRDMLTGLVQEEENRGVDTVLVMGSRGRGAIKRAVLGSTSDHMLHHMRPGSSLVIVKQ